jgi:hypothetical protein
MFQNVRVTFDNLEGNNWADTTKTSTDSPTGSVSYDKWAGSDQTYNVTVEAINSENTVTNSVTISDMADGVNAYLPSDLGEGENNPELLNWAISDNSNTDSGEAMFNVEYELNNTDRFQEIRAEFENTENDWSDETDTSTESPTGSFSYSEWVTTNDQYNITLRVFNTDGVATDLDSRIVTANGDDPEGGRGTERSIEQFDVTDQSQWTGGFTCRGQDKASYQVDWSATGLEDNIENANVSFNGVVPGDDWRSASGSSPFEDTCGTYGEEYKIRFQVSYSNGDYLCGQYTDTADTIDPSGGYSDCS